VGSAADRHYIRTFDSDYFNQDFAYEITFTAGAGDITYVGIRAGMLGSFDEPSGGSLYLRIHAVEPAGRGEAGRIDLAFDDPFNTLAMLGYETSDGLNRVRIAKAGNLVTFGVDQSFSGGFNADFQMTVNIENNPAVLSALTGECTLFFGTGQVGTTFDDFSVAVVPEPQAFSLVAVSALRRTLSRRRSSRQPSCSRCT
jgi:hypothetical protein